MATMITPADILKERERCRSSFMLAHSANVDGSFMARMGCPCYTCRDVLDPTGEEDAAAASAVNENREPFSLPPLSLPAASLLPVRSSGGGIGVMGLAPAPSTSPTSTTGHLSSYTPPPLFRHARAEPDHMKDAIASLKLEVNTLRAKQEEVYEKEAHSHDEMAMQDHEWNEYDQKIMTLETIIDTLSCM